MRACAFVINNFSFKLISILAKSAREFHENISNITKYYFFPFFFYFQLSFHSTFLSSNKRAKKIHLTMKRRLKIDQRFSKKRKREHVSSELHWKRLSIVNRHPLRIQLHSNRFDSIEAFWIRILRIRLEFSCFPIGFANLFNQWKLKIDHFQPRSITWLESKANPKYKQGWNQAWTETANKFI